jgi:hypothetical protein
VLQRVGVLRILAAADMTAGQAHAQLVPLRTERDAFLAAVGPGRDLPDLGEVLAGFFLHRSGARGLSIDERDNDAEDQHQSAVEYDCFSTTMPGMGCTT